MSKKDSSADAETSGDAAIVETEDAVQFEEGENKPVEAQADVDPGIEDPVALNPQLPHLIAAISTRSSRIEPA